MALTDIASGPNLIQSLKIFRSVMVNASGVFFWIPLSFYVSLEHSQEHFHTLTRLLLPLIIFYFFIFLINSFKIRVALNLIIYFFIYLSIYLFGSEIQTVAIPFGVIFLAGIILISFGLNYRYALLILPVLLVMEFLIATRVGDKLLLSGAGYNINLFILFHLFIAFIAIAFNYSLEKTLNLVDKETLDFALQNQTREALSIQNALLRNLKNKIHGILLTHLSLIGQKRMKILDPNLISQINNDLSSTQAIETSLEEISLLNLLKDATGKSALYEVNIFLGQVPDLQLSKKLANDLEEVVLEVLRNITKHASATSIHLTGKLIRGDLKILLEDDGIGPEKIQVNRFGVKSAILETLTSINGSVKYLNRKPQGTITEIIIPAHKEVSLKNLSPNYISSLIYSREIKYLIICLQLILYIYFLSNAVAIDNPFIFLIHAIVIFTLIASLISNNPKVQNLFSALFFSFSIFLIFYLSSLFNEITYAGAWNWILNAFNLAFIFYIGFQKRAIFRWWSGFIYVSCLVAVIFNMNPEVRAIMLPPFINGFAAGVAFVGAILLFNKKIIQKISAYESTYLNENFKLASEEFQKISKSLWQTNPSVGASLITRAINSPAILEDPGFIREAQIEQARLRSLLNINPAIDSKLNVQILKIIKIASENKNIFELEFRGTQENNPPVPEVYFDFVKSLVEIEQVTPIFASIFSSESDIQITLVVEKAAYERVLKSSTVDLSNNEKWELEIETDDVTSEQVWFLISKLKTNV